MPDDAPVDRWRPQPAAGEHRDELPAQLDATGYVGPYMFPDVRRRRIPALVYGAAGGVLTVVWAVFHPGGVLVNGGFLAAALALALVAGFHWVAAYPLRVRDLDALSAASRVVGFAVGHASAQLGWRGVRSRPTWRILLYSADDPPSRRGLVLVDAVDGGVVDHYVEDNPEDWSSYSQ
jgi:hypothetical protein